MALANDLIESRKSIVGFFMLSSSDAIVPWLKLLIRTQSGAPHDALLAELALVRTPRTVVREENEFESQSLGRER